jgi:hypothetical protein
MARMAASTEKCAMLTEFDTTARAASFGVPIWTTSRSRPCAVKNPLSSATYDPH